MSMALVREIPTRGFARMRGALWLAVEQKHPYQLLQLSMSHPALDNENRSRANFRRECAREKPDCLTRDPGAADEPLSCIISIMTLYESLRQKEHAKARV